MLWLSLAFGILGLSCVPLIGLSPRLTERFSRFSGLAKRIKLVETLFASQNQQMVSVL